MRTIPFILLTAAAMYGAQAGSNTWKRLSSKTGDFPAPNPGTQQTSATVFDIDKDGVNDFVITERTAAPSVVWYRRNPSGWTRYVMEATRLQPEAGATFYDVDSDGDLDFAAAGDFSTNQIWWWENPYPNYDPGKPWKRRLIKDSGARKHHDCIFGDFDGDGKDEFVFWNQGGNALMMARIPPDPRNAGPWKFFPIYEYSGDSEPEQRGKPDAFKKTGEHEGLWKADIDGDGKLDIVGGGRWFKHLGSDRYLPNIIDANYTFSRAAAGQLKKGGRPEVLLVVGDGLGPLLMYEWTKGAWIPHKLLDVTSGHSIGLIDFDGDGNLDIFCAEMRLNGENEQSKIYILLGDGNGNFKTTVVDTGFDLHEAKIADLDGNGTYDILGKPYNYETPALNIWLNMGKK